MSIKKLIEKVSLLLALILAINSSLFLVQGQTAASSKQDIQIAQNTIDSDYITIIEYEDFLNNNAQLARPSKDIIIEGENTSSAGKEIIKKENDGTVYLQWNSKSGIVAWTADIPEDCLYQIELVYKPLKNANHSFDFELSVNNETEFKQAKALSLPFEYINSTEVLQDNRGNDLRPMQVVNQNWTTNSVSDAEGIYNDPYVFKFSKGINTIQIKASNAFVAIDRIRLYNKKENKTYKEYISQFPDNKINGVLEYIQAEDATLKSDSVLYPTYDRANSSTYPNDPVHIRFNTIGGANWKDQGQYIVWKTTVKKAGLYKIGIKSRQNLARGVISYRRLYINEKVPFEEANYIKFPFSSRWQAKILGDDKNGDWLFYLDEGVCTLKLEVVPGSMGEILKRINTISARLTDLYRDIIMITGVSPDPNRDYLLMDQIPDLKANFKNVRSELAQLIKVINKQNDTKGLSDSTAIINTLFVQIGDFLENPDTIPDRLSSFEANLSSFFAFGLKLQDQPLEIDYFAVMSAEKTDFKIKNYFLDGILFSFQAFLGSFYEDYSSVGNLSGNKKSINVWVNLSPGAVGRDQAQVIKDLSDNMFQPKSGIQVNIKLVQQSLIPAILSNRVPDVALFIGMGDPVNLAVRGGIEDISKYPDFNEVIKRFGTTAMSPYYFNGGVYALPISESFPMMFCRNDILNELGVKPPATWDEFYKVLSVVQKSNMQIGIPNMQSGNQMLINNYIFAMLLYQRDVAYYKEDLSSTNFDLPEATEAFRQWTGFYKNYGLPMQYDFYQRFRMGSMPIAITDYTMYQKLTVAAPEIRDLWQMYPVPGTVKKDGTIDRTAIASSTCALILKNSKNKHDAWEFLKWFTDTESQTQYSLEIESLLGPAGRYPTANLAAFDNLPWDKRTADEIKEQWKSVNIIPQTPWGYSIDRNLTNAFRQVVFYNKNLRETLTEYNTLINVEIDRKRKSLGM